MKLVLGIEITGSSDYFKIRNDFGMAKHQAQYEGKPGKACDVIWQGQQIFAKAIFPTCSSLLMGIIL